MIIEVNHVSKRIGSAEVLKDITISFSSGKIYGLRGYNGSGKTMFLRLIAGLIRPTSGMVTVDQKVLGKDISFPPRIGVLIEKPAFLDQYTGLRNLELLLELSDTSGRVDLKECMRDVGLDPENQKPYRKYSLGMKQRLGIAAALMGMPDLILLDEPTNALDSDGILKVKELIQREKNRGALVVTASHEASFLEDLCDVICDFDSGRMFAGEERGRDHATDSDNLTGTSSVCRMVDTL